MAKEARKIPDLSNATPEFLVSQIRAMRDQQADGKFFEGIYKERLKTFDEYSPEVKALEERKVGDMLVKISTAPVERIDVEAVKAAFTREELIARGFLKVSDVTTLGVKKAPV